MNRYHQFLDWFSLNYPIHLSCDTGSLGSGLARPWNLIFCELHQYSFAHFCDWPTNQKGSKGWSFTGETQKLMVKKILITKWKQRKQTCSTHSSFSFPAGAVLHYAHRMRGMGSVSLIKHAHVPDSITALPPQLRAKPGLHAKCSGERIFIIISPF